MENRDWKIIELILKLRYIFAEFLVIIGLFKNIKLAARKLSVLKKREYLIASKYKTAKSIGGRPKHIYSTSPQYLKELVSTGKKVVTSPRLKIGTMHPEKLHHLIGINRFVINIMEACTKHNLELSFFLEHSLSIPDNYKSAWNFLNIPGKNNKYCISDGLFCISSDYKKSMLCLYEFDNSGTEPVNSIMRQKFDTYNHFYDSKGFSKYSKYFTHNFSGFRLLIEVSSLTRLNSIKKLAIEMNANYVWITTTNDIKANSILAKIWEIADPNRPGLHPLIKENK